VRAAPQKKDSLKKPTAAAVITVIVRNGGDLFLGTTHHSIVLSVTAITSLSPAQEKCVIRIIKVWEKKGENYINKCEKRLGANRLIIHIGLYCSSQCKYYLPD